MKTILITGINGFLGSHLAKALTKNYNVIGLEIESVDLIRIDSASFKVYPANKTGIEAIFKENKVEYILHTATLYGRNDTLGSTLISNNVLAPIQLLEIGIQNGVKAFINTDSFFNDGKLNYSYLTGYTLSKKGLLDWLIQYQNQVKIINMKIFHMYGPDDAPGKFIPWILDQLKRNVPEIDLTPGEQKRDFIFIDDVVSAYDIVLRNIPTIKEKFISFDVGTGKAIPLNEFIQLAKNTLNSTSKLNFGKLEYRSGEIMMAEADISKLKSLGWKSKSLHEDSLKRDFYLSK